MNLMAISTGAEFGRVEHYDVFLGQSHLFFSDRAPYLCTDDLAESMASMRQIFTEISGNVNPGLINPQK